MAPTPITATHRMTIFYTVALFPHRIHLYVDAYSSVLLTSGWGITTFDLDTLDAGDAASGFGTLLSEYIEADDHVDSWLLEEYSSGAYIFKASGTLGTAGTHSATGQRSGAQLTIFFRDTANKPLKIVVGEPTLAVFSRYASGAGVPSDIDAISDSMLLAGGGNLGNWVRSRGDRQRDRFISVVGTLNRKLRRARGIA